VGRERGLATIFGEVVVDRVAYRERGHADLHPADAVLNLPAEKHSHGLRRLAALEATRGSFGQAVAAIGRVTGQSMGKLRTPQHRPRRSPHRARQRRLRLATPPPHRLPPRHPRHPATLIPVHQRRHPQPHQHHRPAQPPHLLPSTTPSRHPRSPSPMVARTTTELRAHLTPPWGQIRCARIGRESPPP
jgi:hypothetical protein